LFWLSEHLPQKEGRGKKLKHFLLLLSAAEFSVWNSLAQEIKGGMLNNR